LRLHWQAQALLVRVYELLVNSGYSSGEFYGSPKKPWQGVGLREDSHSLHRAQADTEQSYTIMYTNQPQTATAACADLLGKQC